MDNLRIVHIESNEQHLGKGCQEHAVRTIQCFTIATKTTNYIGARVYESNATETQALQFIHHEEGRIVPGPDVSDLYWTPNSKDWEYQYHIKDHLGNTRVTFADPLLDYLVTMEGGADRVEEQRLGFDNLDLTQHQDINNALLLDHTNQLTDANGQTIYPNADMVCFLNGVGDRIFGPAKSLQVMPGDEIDLSVYYKYVELPTETNSKTLASFLLSAYNGSFATQLGELALASGSNLDASFLESGMEVVDGENGNTVPDAYLNIIIVDENFGNAVGYKKPIGPDGKVVDMGDHGLLSHNISIQQKGYVYVYLSNETPGSEVYFDDFLIGHKPNPIIQKDDYYPFGLSIAGLNFGRENSIKNKWTFQGQELQDDLDLGWYSFKWRNHDPAIGRFFNIDPLAEKFYYNSPLAFSENKVTTHFELEGLEGIQIHEYNEDGGLERIIYQLDIYVVTNSSGEANSTYTSHDLQNIEDALNMAFSTDRNDPDSGVPVAFEFNVNALDFTEMKSKRNKKGVKFVSGNVSYGQARDEMTSKGQEADDGRQTFPALIFEQLAPNTDGGYTTAGRVIIDPEPKEGTVDALGHA